jgi:hypothetical protein
MQNLPRHSHVDFPNRVNAEAFGWRNSVSAYEAMIHIDADTVFLTIVTYAILFNPAGI